MNCVLYARVSTDKQAEKDLSIPAQLAAMREYASARGWKVISEFVEPGASARTADRPELQRLLGSLNDVAEPVQVVLVHKIDRLARNLYDHATIKAGLHARGIRLASVVENVEPTVSGELVENIMASIAQFYSANLSEEVKKGMKQKVLAGGWPHRPPRGYVIVRHKEGAAGVIEIHPKDGPLMKRAFELYATGWYSVKVLSKRLARDGLVARDGQPLSPAHLRRLLANPFYTGTVHWQERQYAGSHPPLISNQLFVKVQEVIRARFTNPGPNGSTIPGFPLRGIAFCATCRGRMTGERHGKWSYYRCSRQTYRRAVCAARFCSTKRADVALERICRAIQISRDFASQVELSALHIIRERAISAVAESQRQSRDGDKRLLENSDWTRAFLDGDLTPRRFGELASQAIPRHETPSNNCDPAIAAEQVHRILMITTSVWDMYVSLPESERTPLLRTIFNAMILDHTGIVGVHLKPAFATLLKGAATGQGPANTAASLIQCL